MTRSRILKALGATLLTVLVVGVLGFLWYAQPQPLLPEATAALASTERATYDGSDGLITYTPTAGTPTTGLILYPGGKVPSAAYAPQARAIAESGYLTVDRLGPVQLRRVRHRGCPAGHRRSPGDRALGGRRSLARRRDGGAVPRPATRARPTVSCSGPPTAATDLSAQDLAVASIYGSLDTGIPSYTSATAIANVGPNLVTTVIDGGNHEQMGWYTGQPNDPPATISRVDQQAQVIAATERLLDEVGDPVR